MEAGYRCAIPVCRQTPIEVAHIVPWEEVKSHSFDNLIALCPTCHTRYDRGEIDRQAMRLYKANLGLVNGRYIDVEKRVLEILAEQPNATQIWLPSVLGIFVRNLVKDGLLEPSPMETTGLVLSQLYNLTEKGREFVRKWVSAEELD
jgi:hypothetical protein